MKAVEAMTPLPEIVAYLKESERTGGLRGVASDTDNHTVSFTDGQDAVLNISTGTGIESGTELSTNGVSGCETGTEEIIALVNHLVNAYDHTISNSK